MLLAELGPRGKGRLLEVTQLIEQGADVNCKDYKGFTPIYNGKFPNNKILILKHHESEFSTRSNIILKDNNFFSYNEQ